MNADASKENCISDADIVASLRSGDSACIEVLVARYQAPLLRYAFRLLGEPTAAEDVVQESFIRLLTSLEQLRDPTKLRSYLYQIATRLCRDQQRRPSRREQPVGEWESDALATCAPESTDERFYIADLLRRLNPRHAEVIVLRYYEDMDLATIACILNVPVGTVKSRLHSALRRLHDMLTEPEFVRRKAAVW
ncbi:MAG TPA: RNA polymerase sigma factor [Firmicutes bacterium]|nr:RNA polymerase sigma factor [Bacillota bacterium]